MYKFTVVYHYIKNACGIYTYYIDRCFVAGEEINASDPSYRPGQVLTGSIPPHLDSRLVLPVVPSSTCSFFIDLILLMFLTIGDASSSICYINVLSYFCYRF